MSRGPRASQGWSLIEAVVALALLALVLGAAYQVLAGAARRAALVQHYAEALAIAEAKLGEAAAASAAGGAGQGQAGRGFVWRVQVEPYAAAGAASESLSVAPEEVRVDVRWTLDGGTRTLSLSTLRLRYAP